jgi:hypothetical protein
MTLDQLKTIFTYQTTADEHFTPTDTVEYMLIDATGRILKTCPINDIESLMPLFDTHRHEGYRDRTPIFMKPESEM